MPLWIGKGFLTIRTERLTNRSVRAVNGHSKRIRDQPLKHPFVGPARAQLNSIAERHQILRMVDRLHAADSFRVHDHRAMNAHESYRIEAFRNLRHRDFHKMTCRAYMQFDIVLRGIEPFDVIRADEDGSLSPSNGDSIQVPLLVREPLQDRQHTRIGSTRSHTDARFRPL